MTKNKKKKLTERERNEQIAKELESMLKMMGKSLKPHEKFLSFTKEELINADLSHLYEKPDPLDNPNSPEYFYNQLSDNEKRYYYELTEVERIEEFMGRIDEVIAFSNKEREKYLKALDKGEHYQMKQYRF
ncbi:hypothetical protein ACNZ6T_002673 [Enterococcus faecium]|uniref:Uncharacterized protein n=1 Tax=Enterococcus gallinarum TaxID=1353 RepID=A0AAE7T1M9_ENTGA|nr:MULTISPECIES: hypothetical protein [Enterococcus]EGP5438668.1 hypothetical protein [Enterococcus faecium]EHA4046225.1 hypothetical protein [Enterococcus faecalis]EHQ3681903.1 hypothetical protein [Enterococcus faecium]EJE4057162.1 hypothetical protein [Enterococcus faecalis]EKZ0236304.1 hypothetical protein [Enterococcus faecalis]